MVMSKANKFGVTLCSLLYLATFLKSVGAADFVLCTELKAEAGFCNSFTSDQCDQLDLADPCPRLCNVCIESAPTASPVLAPSQFPTPAPTASPIPFETDVNFGYPQRNNLNQSDNNLWSRANKNTIGFTSGYETSDALTVDNGKRIGLTFLVGDASDAKIGLVNTQAANDGYTRASSAYYGFWFASFGQVVVVEGGKYVAVVTSTSTHEHSVYFNIEHHVVYTVNGVVRHTSSAPVNATTQFSAMLAIEDATTNVGPVQWLSKALWCDGIVCPSDQCTDANICSEGVCGPPTPKQDNLACDDNDATTNDDVCTNGMCAGVDPCAEVTCPIVNPCFPTPTCVQGSCEQGVSADDGASCTTTVDAEPGQCIGGDCMRITTTSSPTPAPSPIPTHVTLPDGFCTNKSMCPEDVACSVPFQCISITNTGICVGGEVLPDGTGCDDGETNTVGDACTNGVCVGVDPCADVVCSTDNDCETTECVRNGNLGECKTTLKSSGSSCSDGKPFTFRDQCYSGVCIGINPCAAVNCNLIPTAQCRRVGVCVTDASGRPSCTEPLAGEGTRCDDDDDQTTNDKCTIDGGCAGSDPCIGFTCPSPDQCYLESACVVNGGQAQCENRDQFPVGSSCSDGNERTGEDACNAAGVCVGSTLCEDVDCGPRQECYEERECLLGECLPANVLDDFSDCDDGDDETRFDSCFDGICAGRNICQGVSCPDKSDDQCRQETGQCIVERDELGENPTTACDYALIPFGTPCDDGNNATSLDVCDNGVCEGDNLCFTRNVTCAPPLPCYAPTTCFQGSCSYTELADQSPCQLVDGVTPKGVDAGVVLPLDAALHCMAGECVLVDDCADVTCPSTDQCRDPPTCQLGYPNETRCERVGARKAQNTLCNDDNNRTVYDLCLWDVAKTTVATTTMMPITTISSNDTFTNDTVATTVSSNATFSNDTFTNDTVATTGAPSENVTQAPPLLHDVVCRGVDLCEGVVCQPPDQCHEAVECEYPFGVCPNRLILVNKSCDDGNFETQDDTCNEAGDCVGVDRCVGMVCEENDCYDNLGCLHGICNETKHPDGSTCDDLDPSSLNDTCTGGLCFGIPKEEVCFQEADCNATGCVQEVYPDGTLCDDKWVLSYGDICLGGQCFGQLPCPSSCVSWTTKVGVQETTKYGLTRSKLGDDWTTAAVSSGMITIPHHNRGRIAVGNESLNVGVEFQPGQSLTTFFVGFLTTSTTSLKFGDTDWGLLFNYRGYVSVLVDGTFYPSNTVLSYEAADTIMLQIGYDQTSDTETFNVVQNGKTVFSAPWTNAMPGAEYTTLVNIHQENASVEQFSWMTAKQSCETIVCGDDGQCREQPYCFLGSCLDGENINENLFCDDDNNRTDMDVCVNGVCKGTDFCILGNVVCATPNQCEEDVTCFQGECISTLKSTGTVCDDGDNGTTSDECTAGVCSGVDLCIGQPPCDIPDVDRCLQTSRCYRGDCLYEPFAVGTVCSDGDATTANDVCFGDLDSCKGEMLSCSSNTDGSIEFKGCDNQSTLLSTSKGFDFEAVSTSVPPQSDACVCTTSYGSIMLQAVRLGVSVDSHAVSDSECARLLCTDDNYRFKSCHRNGVTVAVGEWNTAKTVTVSGEYKNSVCEAGDIVTPSSDTLSPTAKATSCPQGDCHIALDASAGQSQDCVVSTNQVVSWEWSDVGLNVRSDGGLFTDSGDPVLEGCYSYRFEKAGVYPFHALLYPQTVFGKVTVQQSFEIITDPSFVTKKSVLWGPDVSSHSSICIGDSVHWYWTNTDEEHSVVSGSIFSSGEPSSTGSLKVRFMDSGLFVIHDAVHPWVEVTLEVKQCAPTTQAPTVITDATTVVTSTQETTLPIDCSTESTAGIPLIETEVALEFDGDVGIVLDTSTMPYVSNTFSVIVSFTVSRGGYVFARSNKFGHRHYSLFVDGTAGLRFFYRVQGDNAQEDAILFPDRSFADGEHYTVLLAVHGDTVEATAVSDTSPLGSSSDDLKGFVQDCNPNGRSKCVFVVGARANGLDEFAYGMTGTVDDLLLFPNCKASTGLLPTTPPIEYAPTEDNCFDLLAPFTGSEKTSENLADFLLENGTLDFSSDKGLNMYGPKWAPDTVFGAFFTFTQDAGSDGYLFAKTDETGLKRYFALYARSDKIRFFYIVKATGDQGSKDFDLDGVNLQDGQPHQLTFWVFHGYVALLIDNKRFMATDLSPIGDQVADCLVGKNTPDCVMRVGQRSSRSGGIQNFEGTMSYASLCNFEGFPKYPIAGGANVQHLLRHSTSPGVGSYEIKSFKQLPSKFSLFFDIQSDDADSTAYLFSKISDDLKTRYFSVYALSRELRFSYHPKDAIGDVDLPLKNVPFLFDGVRHRILITVDGSTLVVRVDDLYTQERRLQRPIEDCTTDCMLHLGQKSTKAGEADNFNFEGNMYRAELYYDQILESFP